MATKILTRDQSKTEIRTHYADFTDDLPAGVTVSTATATHTPPSGAASTPTVGAPASNVVPVTLGPLAVTGLHTLEVLATLSDGQKSSLLLSIPVNY